MNSNKKLSARAADVVGNTKAKAVALGTAAATAAGSAVAGGGGGGFDSGAITSVITSNTAIGVAILGAMAVGIWTLRSMGLLQRR